MVFLSRAKGVGPFETPAVGALEDDMVRVKLDPEDKLSEVLSLKVRRRDKAFWTATVASSGMKPSEYFRQALLESRTVIVQVVGQDPHFIRFLGIYSALSKRLGWLAHQATVDRDLGRLSEEGYRELLSGFMEALEFFRQELNRAS